MNHLKCDAKTLHDCCGCGKFTSSHSEHYCDVYNKKVSEVSCNIGGNRVFDESGKRIDK